MIDIIDLKIKKLLEIRDSEYVLKYTELRATICNVSEKAYLLEVLILQNKKIKENEDDQFFIASAAVNRHFRDWGLDEVADIYNELRLIAKDYIYNLDTPPNFDSLDFEE